MRTKLQYEIERKESYEAGKIINHIIGRCFEFSVSGAKTKEEHDNVINNFADFLGKNNIEYYGFGDGSFKYSKHFNDTSSYHYLQIPIKNIEDKEYIKEIYKEWKSIQQK